MGPGPQPPGLPRSLTLTPAECVDRLASSHIGRIAWLASNGLQLLPISYAWHDHSVVFRTSAYGVLAELVRPTEAIFEVDELDPEGHAGWSVVVKGTAAAIAEPADLVQLWTVDGLTPWAEGIRTLFIRLSPSQLTGRRFTLSAR